MIPYHQGLVEAVPPEEQEKIQNLINRALGDGWAELGLWTGDEPVRWYDLCGLPPGLTWVRTCAFYYKMLF